MSRKALPVCTRFGCFLRMLSLTSSLYSRRLVKLWKAWTPLNSARQLRRSCSRSSMASPAAANNPRLAPQCAKVMNMWEQLPSVFANKRYHNRQQSAISYQRQSPQMSRGACIGLTRSATWTWPHLPLVSSMGTITQRGSLTSRLMALCVPLWHLPPPRANLASNSSQVYGGGTAST